MEFEQKIKEAAESAVLKFIRDGGWLLPNYESRVKVPAEWVQGFWNLVDRENLKKQIAARIESELADRIINSIAAELATDIKQILSVTERREAIRGIAREHMSEIMAKGLSQEAKK